MNVLLSFCRGEAVGAVDLSDAKSLSTGRAQIDFIDPSRTPISCSSFDAKSQESFSSSGSKMTSIISTLSLLYRSR